jgi:hypothetical protein
LQCYLRFIKDDPSGGGDDDVIATTRAFLVDIDPVAGNLFDLDSDASHRVVRIELVVVVKNARSVLAWKDCFGSWICVWTYRKRVGLVLTAIAVEW